MRVSGYDSLMNVLRVGESSVRESDLAMMSLLYPGGLDFSVVDTGVKYEILSKVKKLEGEFGFKRFFGDDWDGLVHYDGCEGRDMIRDGHEMQWVMGGDWKAIYRGKQEDKDKALDIFRKYGSPEGFVPIDRNDLSKGWKVNCTPFLFWTASMQESVMV